MGEAIQAVASHHAILMIPDGLLGYTRASPTRHFPRVQ